MFYSIKKGIFKHFTNVIFKFSLHHLFSWFWGLEHWAIHIYTIVLCSRLHVHFHTIMTAVLKGTIETLLHVTLFYIKSFWTFNKMSIHLYIYAIKTQPAKIFGDLSVTVCSRILDMKSKIDQRFWARLLPKTSQRPLHVSYHQHQGQRACRPVHQTLRQLADCG